MSKSNDSLSQQFGNNKKLRRKIITWGRVFRYGVNNFTRNAWLSTAATLVMTITLMIIFSSVISRVVLNNTVDGIRQRVDIPINLRSNVSKEDIRNIRQKIEKLSDVKEVSLVSVEQAKTEFLQKNKLSPVQLQTISELPNPPFYPTLKVIVNDPASTSQLSDLVAKDSLIKNSINTNPALAPAFSGENKKVIETLSSWANTAEKAGLLAGSLFVLISMLIIFNTIRMAIFSRKDEIEMMKLIGADKNFIRDPFVVEAVMYGFFAAILATLIGVLTFINIEPALSRYGIATTGLHSSIIEYSPLILLAMMAIGSVIGFVSSRLAVRRYLKI